VKRMMHQSRFLTAEWNNLLLLNYAVDPCLLERFVPAGTELDVFEGRNYLSLVGFEFNRSRIFGFAVPFHQAFEEVNLRFYVRRGVQERCGVHSGAGSETRGSGHRAICVQRKLFVRSHVASN
jgi:uncharacterized protein YqjF (DUF2071 family)